MLTTPTLTVTTPANAAVARQRVTRAVDGGGKDSGHRLHAGIATLVPMVIVVGLEVVDVQQQQCQGPLVALSAAPFVAQHVVKMPPVGNAGQRIGDVQQGQIGRAHV